MARPDPIQYAGRLYGAIRAANFSPISFLAFGNAIKEGVSMRNMPRIAAEPFMRIVGEMLDLEDKVEAGSIVDVPLTTAQSAPPSSAPIDDHSEGDQDVLAGVETSSPAIVPGQTERKPERNSRRRGT
jgi:hypothetical protein